MVQAVAGCWCCLTAPHFITFLSPWTCPLAPVVIGCIIGEAVPHPALRTDSKLENRVPMGVPATGMSDTGRTAGGGVLGHGCWNQWALESQSAVTCWGICSRLCDVSKCFTHKDSTCTGIGSGREKPGKKSPQIGLTHLGEDATGCGVHLFSHFSPLVLLILGQLPLKLSPGLDKCLQPLQGHIEAEHSLSLQAHISIAVKRGGVNWQQYQGGQAMALTWALPQGLFEEWEDL